MRVFLTDISLLQNKLDVKSYYAINPTATLNSRRLRHVYLAQPTTSYYRLPQLPQLPLNLTTSHSRLPQLPTIYVTEQ